MKAGVQGPKLLYRLGFDDVVRALLVGDGFHADPLARRFEIPVIDLALLCLAPALDSALGVRLDRIPLTLVRLPFIVA